MNDTDMGCSKQHSESTAAHNERAQKGRRAMLFLLHETITRVTKFICIEGNAMADSI